MFIRLILPVLAPLAVLVCTSVSWADLLACNQSPNADLKAFVEPAQFEVVEVSVSFPLLAKAPIDRLPFNLDETASTMTANPSPQERSGPQFQLQLLGNADFDHPRSDRLLVIRLRFNLEVPTDPILKVPIV